MIFEDRKFADISAVLVNVVYAQVLNFTRLFRVPLNDQITFIHGKQETAIYSLGVYKISSWAHITNPQSKELSLDSHR